MIKTILSAVIVIAGLCLGAYVGLWLCFVGGIIQVVEACKVTPIEASEIAIGLLRVVMTGFVGWVIVIASVFLSALVGNWEL